MRKKKILQSKIQKDNFCEIDKLLFEYDQYLDSTRGLSLGTRKLYCSYSRVFLRLHFKSNRICINALHSKDVIRFIISYTQTGGAKRTRHMVYALRSFFRFLKQTKRIKEELAESVPAVAVWRQNSFPVLLSADEIQRLLSSCDISCSKGLRDYAVLMLLVHLGLRASEVCKLTLDDFDWDNGEIIIRGKGSSVMRLPIFKDLGNALVAYLQFGRPNCKRSRSFFITVNSPLRGFQTSSAVRGILRAALERAGLNPAKKGTHLLRHALAIQLLQHGATLQEIGMILCHKDVSTTAIYARVDFDKLRMIALPWPSQHKEGSIL